MKTIERKTMLYKTGVEYGDYTINHVQGCAHGCKFPCYAMMMAKPCFDNDDPKDKVRNKLKHYNLMLSYCNPNGEQYQKLKKEK